MVCSVTFFLDMGVDLLLYKLFSPVSREMTLLSSSHNMFMRSSVDKQAEDTQ